MHYPDGERDFGVIERDLCAAMLESQLATYQQTESMHGHDYYPGLRVFPLEGVDELNAMCASEEADSIVWRICKWRPQLIELRFRALFDFETFRGLFRDFRYVDCIVLQSRDDDIAVGQRLLVDAVDVRLFDASLSDVT